MTANQPFHISTSARRLGVVAWFLFLAVVQLFILPRGESQGPWFLFGTDSVSHDIPVQLKIWNDLAATNELPLWMPELQGGLPTLGSFLWAPAAPSNVAFAIFAFPLAQKLQFLWALVLAGLGGWYLGRVQGLRPSASLLLGTSLCLSGHLVTLIYAGHLQKILALAWLPWFLAGLIGVCFHASATSRARNACIAAAALGMAFLNGHPQVAYMMLMAAPMLLVVRGIHGKKEARPSILEPAAVLACVVVLGFCFGALQLLPGMEMKRLSNRAERVEFAEAVETSYPKGELLEFFFPRHKGDSSDAGFHVYVGEWGERLVSDYAGITLGFFLIIGLFTAFKRPLSQFWLLLLLASIFIGLGKNTPVYGVLYNLLPGFSSFRSPGTFFALAAIAIPALAAVGFELLLDRFQPKIPTYLRTFGMLFSVGLFLYMFSYTEQSRWERYLLSDPTELEYENFFWFYSLSRSSLFIMLSSLVPLVAYAIGGKLGGTRQLIGGLMLACLAVDLSLANSAFLKREPWAKYQLYLEPTPTDSLLLTEEKPLRVLNYDSLLSMRPVPQGRDALQGYHPISFESFLEQMRTTPLSEEAGMKALGVSYVFTESSEAPVPLADLRGIVRGQFLWQLPAPYQVVEVMDASGKPMLMSCAFESRTPNAALMKCGFLDAGTVIIKENAAPGWQYRWGESGSWVELNQEGFLRTVPKPQGEHQLFLRYQPRSVQLGALLTLLSGILLSIVFLATVLPVSDKKSQNSKPI